MKVLIFGAKGMLGNDLRNIFSDLNPYTLDKDELDITNKAAVVDLVEKMKPDVIINSAAYTDVDGCESNREFAVRVNSDGARNLAEAAARVDSVFAHYSTDYVFRGNKQEGYKEDEEPGDSINFYGESKLMGEEAIKDVGGKYYIVRTSWLFGIGGEMFGGHSRNFVENIIRLSREQETLKVVDDQHGKPTFALDLAQATRRLVEAKEKLGIYHITNEPETTWYEFAKEIAKQAGIDVKISPCASEEFPRPAKRPEYSSLINTKLPLLRPWQEALGEYLSLRK